MCNFCRWFEDKYRARVDKKVISHDEQRRMQMYLMRLDSKKEALTISINDVQMEIIIDYCPFCGRNLKPNR